MMNDKTRQVRSSEEDSASIPVGGAIQTLTVRDLELGIDQTGERVKLTLGHEGTDGRTAGGLWIEPELAHVLADQLIQAALRAEARASDE
jgi:hypothetical protein